MVKNQYIKVCDIVKRGGEIFIFEWMVFKIINYMLYLVKVDFHFKFSITFYYCKKNNHDAMQHWHGDRPFNSHTHKKKKKQIALAYGKSEFVFL